MATSYRVDVRRDGRWWFFEIPALDLSGQARKLSEVEFEATDIIATWLRVDPDSVVVDLDIQVPAEVSRAWGEAKRREALAREESAAAARLAREAVARLRAGGMTQSDAGRVLGISVQRISQLEAGDGRRLRRAG